VARNEIPPDLDREIELRLEKLAREQHERLTELKSDFEKFSEPNGELQHSNFDLAEQLLRSQKWHEFNKLVNRLASSIEERKTIQKKVLLLEQFRLEVSLLGGSATESNTVEQLQAQCIQLIDSTAERRRHLRHIDVLKNSAGLDSLIVEAAVAAASHLRKHVELPEPENAEYVAYIFSEVFDPIADQLRRSKNLLPTYSAKLNAICITILRSLSQAGAVSNAVSVQLKLMERYAARFTNVADLDLLGISSLHDSVITDLQSIVEPQKPSLSLAPHGTVERKEDSGAIDNLEADALEKIESLLLVPSRLEDPSFGEEAILEDWIERLRTTDDVSLEEHAALVALASRRSNSPTMRPRLSTRNLKGTAWEIAGKLIVKLALMERRSTVQPSLVDSLEYLASRVGFTTRSHELAVLAFGQCNEENPAAVKWLWDHFSGDPKQAEGRAAFMTFLAQCELVGAVTYCLTASPIDFVARKARALAQAAVQAQKSRNGQIIQSFTDLRRSPGSKVFQIFADHIAALLPAQSQTTAIITIVGELESLGGSEGAYKATLRVVPNTNDWPQTIDLVMPLIVPLRDHDGGRRIRLEGPFVEETNLPVVFLIAEAQASNFVANIECVAVSISGARSTFGARLDVSISDAAPFEAASKQEIERAFDGFPSHQMRGDDYIPRADDEQKIEKALVLSNTVRSIWIASPRRSGKTTMLYRILDAYSHKVDRDNAVVYLTIDRSFNSSEEFNNWVWRKLLNTAPNIELRAACKDLEAIGIHLPFDADSGTFFCELADQLLQSEGRHFSRVIFLIDEVDRFASMHFEGGARRDVARDILWQLRNVIGSRRDIGFVFAGSSAAKRIFVTDPESPFFNSISLLELTPFSSKNKRSEEYSRMIVEPTSLRGRYYFPKESLEHLIWICAGIPYYMKLLAGATLSTSRQRYILRSDVNEGLQALLTKRTGISELDEIGGDPGADELRTMALEVDRDKVLARAVLYAVAEMQSPVSGQRLHRGRISAGESPLVSRYQLNRAQIDRGLDITIDLGLLTLSPDEFPEIYFSIPILGESLRSARGRNWALIDHQLTLISESDDA
jgi:hypothetical protein